MKKKIWNSVKILYFWKKYDIIISNEKIKPLKKQSRILKKYIKRENRSKAGSLFMYKYLKFHFLGLLLKIVVDKSGCNVRAI